MDLDLIVPTYNRSRLLDECLKSVVRAAKPPGMNINVVVVDNNSRDETRQVVTSFLECDSPAFRYLFVERPGKSAALNEAISQSHSEIVGFIDDDEQIDPAWFEVVHREFAADATLQYIGGQCLPNWEVPLPDCLPPISVYGSGLGIIVRPNRVEFNSAFNGILMGGNSVFRRPTLLKAMPIPENIGRIGDKIRSGQDEIVYRRVLKTGARGISVPDLIIYHWIPKERMTRQYYRKWAFGRAVGEGFLLKEVGFAEKGMLGIPRYKIGDALRGLRSMLTGRSQQKRFIGELSIRDCVGLLYGRHVYKNPKHDSVNSSRRAINA